MTLPIVSLSPSQAIIAHKVRALRAARPAVGAEVRPTPLAWAEANATIVHPARGRVPFTPYPYQADFLRAHDTPRRIVLKARQIGFSQVIALEALYYGIYEPESTILLVSRSQDLAANLLRYCYMTYNGLRDAPGLVKENESEMGLANGSRIKSIPANRSTGRGFAASRIYLDEFAYAAYADDIYQSVSPAVSQGGSLTIGSTPDGEGNLFHSLWESGHELKRYHLPWYVCPAYYTPEEQAAGVPHEQAAWYLRERPKFSAQQWAAEYDCDFCGSGGMNLFSVEDIERAAQPYELPPGKNYLTTVDVGRRRDATVINVFETSSTPYRRVHFERLERTPYPYIQSRLKSTYATYPGRMVVESNGVGDPLIENTDVPIEPFTTTARSKLQALQALQLLFEQGNIRAQWDSRERAALIGCSWDEDHTPDEVMSLAIMAAVVESGMSKVAEAYRRRAEQRQASQSHRP